LATVSRGYPPRRGRLPTCSSPVRHGRPPKRLPYDLHALGTPPALFLSQDQTLHQDQYPLRGLSHCLVRPTHTRRAMHIARARGHSIMLQLSRCSGDRITRLAPTEPSPVKRDGQYSASTLQCQARFRLSVRQRDRLALPPFSPAAWIL